MNRRAAVVWRLARPRQWIKNAAVAAPFLFVLGDPFQSVSWRMSGNVFAAVALFCLLSSGVYAINDARDAEADRRHPTKRTRPVAAGDLSPREAGLWGAAWMALALAGAFFLPIGFAWMAAAYLGLQAAYTLGLKRIAPLDVVLIAAGFVLRAAAGARAVHAVISPWLLLCAFLLALFMALCKRRGELLRAEEEGQDAARVRPALRQYDAKILDPLILATGLIAVAGYALYTQWPDTVMKFGTRRLGFTIPFALFGVARYLRLVYRKGQGESPEQALLTDPPMLIALALYAGTLLAVLS